LHDHKVIKRHEPVSDADQSRVDVSGPSTATEDQEEPRLAIDPKRMPARRTRRGKYRCAHRVPHKDDTLGVPE
jgi:hypothetical protein